jgi:hypothetical protein
MRISRQQIDLISDLVEVNRISIRTLKDDIVDHLCCVIENKMADGKQFDQSIEEALRELAPNGLRALQIETELLLNSKNISMKKVMYSIGLLTTISYTMGLMFKLLHMPGGEELINYGFLGFGLIFLPMLTIVRLRKYMEMPGHEKLKVVFGFLSAVFVGLAIFFKLRMDLDPASLMLMIGASIFSFGFLPLHFYGLYKNSATVQQAD